MTRNERTPNARERGLGIQGENSPYTAGPRDGATLVDVRWSVGLLIALSGCHALLGIDDFHTADAGGSSDARNDARSDANVDAFSDSLTCLGTLKPICFTTPPTGMLMIGGAIDTTSDVRCASYPQAFGPDLCVMSGSTVNVAAAMVVGSRPLVLVATDLLTVSGALDASSRSSGMIGAGANGAGCSATAGAPQGQGGSGGGGGGFGGVGGGGGKGSGGALQGAGGSLLTVTDIRGGCAGAKGGDGDPASGGRVGRGGGALALIAGATIRIVDTGSVFASGTGGGRGCPVGSLDGGGGGGGGSGGLIVLDAPMLSISGIVTANGGAGGGGCDLGQGNDGQDGRQTSYNVAAIGGAAESATHGGRGGDGGYLANAAQAGLASVDNGGGGNGGNGGGGGGGGAVGVVWVHGTISGGARVSPAPQQH